MTPVQTGPRDMPLISAHRGGAGGDPSLENTLEAVERAIAAGADYVEFDVRLTRDGQVVLSHDDVVVVGGARRSIAGSTWSELAGSDEPLTLGPVLERLRGRAGAHLDLKVEAGEVEVVARVVEALGVGAVVVTTAHEESVRRLHAWTRLHAAGLLVGLSTSDRRDRFGRGTMWGRLESWFPRHRIRRSGADVVAAHKVWARWWLRSYARRRGLPLMVWTIGDRTELDRWMGDSDTWIVVTDVLPKV